jgi:hypothetical protein
MRKLDIGNYIKERLDDQYNYYSSAAKKAKNRFQVIRALEIIVAATIPFLSALITEELLDLKVLVGLLGVIVTVLSGMLMLFKYQENWVNFRSTAEDLKAEKFLFMTGSGPYTSGNQEETLVARVEAILSAEQEKWQKYASSDSNQSVNTNTSSDEPVTPA